MYAEILSGSMAAFEQEKQKFIDLHRPIEKPWYSGCLPLVAGIAVIAGSAGGYLWYLS